MKKTNHYPTILLGMPSNMGIFSLIQKNLEYHGFYVIPLIYNENEFCYPSLLARFNTKFRQLILNDKQIKGRLKQYVLSQNLLKDINPTQPVDYALFIRADVFHADLLKNIRAQVKYNMVNYQWDGMHRFPAIWQQVDIFDRFYVFDYEDLNHPNHHFLPLTNFYFDHDLNHTSSNDADFYFLGAHLTERAHVIAAFGQYAKQKNWHLDFSIFGTHKNPSSYRKIYPTDNIKLITELTDYEHNLNKAKHAKVLMDFKTPIHNGLSFRAFEALGYRKKLITTNAEVAKYDFYHPNNIFIWDGQDFNGIEAFLQLPYYEIDATIREKYSFKNWIRYVLDIEPYQAITLPQSSRY